MKEFLTKRRYSILQVCILALLSGFLYELVLDLIN